MLHLKLADGSDVFISALAVRYVLTNGHEHQCHVFLDASHSLTIAGDARHVAETVHKALKVIHHNQE